MAPMLLLAVLLLLDVGLKPPNSSSKAHSATFGLTPPDGSTGTGAAASSSRQLRLRFQLTHPE